MACDYDLWQTNVEIGLRVCAIRDIELRKMHRNRSWWSNILINKICAMSPRTFWREIYRLHKERKKRYFLTVVEPNVQSDILRKDSLTSCVSPIFDVMSYCVFLYFTIFRRVCNCDCQYFDCILRLRGSRSTLSDSPTYGRLSCGS